LIGFGERFRQARADNEYINGATSIEALRRDCGCVGFNNLNIQICAFGRERTTKMARTVDACNQDPI
jgi:hypothetical protein